MVKKLGCYDVASKMRDLRDGGWAAFEEAVEPGERRRYEGFLQDFIDGLDLTVRTAAQAEEYLEVPVLASLSERRRRRG